MMADDPWVPSLERRSAKRRDDLPRPTIEQLMAFRSGALDEATADSVREALVYDPETAELYEDLLLWSEAGDEVASGDALAAETLAADWQTLSAKAFGAADPEGLRETGATDLPVEVMNLPPRTDIPQAVDSTRHRGWAATVFASAASFCVGVLGTLLLLSATQGPGGSRLPDGVLSDAGGFREGSIALRDGPVRAVSAEEIPEIDLRPEEKTTLKLVIRNAGASRSVIATVEDSEGRQVGQTVSKLRTEAESVGAVGSADTLRPEFVLLQLETGGLEDDVYRVVVTTEDGAALGSYAFRLERSP